MADKDEESDYRVDQDEEGLSDPVDRDGPSSWAPKESSHSGERRPTPTFNDRDNPFLDRDDDPLADAPPASEEPPAAEPARTEDNDDDFDLPLDEPDDVSVPDPQAVSEETPDSLNARAERELTEGLFFEDPDQTEPGDGISAYSDRTYLDDNFDYGLDDGLDAAPPSETAADDTAGMRRRWLLAPLVIGIAALLLLGVGGYGVLEERNALQTEIRDLQAQLALSVPAERARVERDSTAALAEQLEQLRAELAGVRAERDATARELDAAREALASSEARAERAAEQRDRALAEAETAQARVAAGSTSTVTASGPWFVNFGSYASRDDARRWASKLTVDKGRVVVQDAQSDERTIYRVRVIGLASRDGAEAVARALEHRHELSRLWVGMSASP